MDIEELAFKDRKTLAQLNEKDLLDIIVFLQLDRKQWINQFSKTHNESVDIRKENQKLKKQQQEFIKYLEDEINEHKNKEPFIVISICSSYDLNDIKLKLLEEILKKYKEIIGGTKDE